MDTIANFLEISPANLQKYLDLLIKLGALSFVAYLFKVGVGIWNKRQSFRKNVRNLLAFLDGQFVLTASEEVAAGVYGAVLNIRTHVRQKLSLFNNEEDRRDISGIENACSTLINDAAFQKPLSERQGLTSAQWSALRQFRGAVQNRLDGLRSRYRLTKFTHPEADVETTIGKQTVKALVNSNEIDTFLAKATAGKPVRVTWAANKYDGRTEEGIINQAYKTTHIDHVETVAVVFRSNKDNELQIANMRQDYIDLIET